MATAPALAVTATPAAAITPAEVEQFLRDERLYLYKTCLHFVKNPDNAEDVVQIASIKIFNKAHTFRGDSTFRTWATTLTRRECFMFLRSNKSHEVGLNREIEVTENDLNIHAKRHVQLPAEYHDYGLLKLWRKAIARLSPSYRNVIIAHWIEEKPYYQIAAELGLSIGSVKAYGARGSNVLNGIIMKDEKFALLRSTKPLIPTPTRSKERRGNDIVYLVAPRQAKPIDGTHRSHRNATTQP